MDIDLDSLSRAELTKLRTKVERAIKTHAERERRRALEAAERAAAEHGFSLAQLTGTSASRGRSGKSPLPPKYRNPANSEQTWSGRGRRPDWVKAALEEGKSLSDLAI